MDPWSIAAIVGLVVAGKKFSDDDDDPQAPLNVVEKPLNCPDKTINNQYYDLHSLDTRIITPEVGRRLGGGINLPPKCEIPSLQDRKPQLPFGQPVYNLYGRENVTNKMNNLQPIEKQNIGPGLGVAADVPATGGFQQFFRVLPNNPNDERLIQLPGTNGGPSDPVVKTGSTVIGDLTQFPDKVYTYEPTQNSGQGQGGVLRGPESRPEWVKLYKPTNRQQTGSRENGDDVQYGTSQYNVYQPYGDMSAKESTWKALPRITDNRSKPDREGNGQRMNVRADPLDAGGLVSNLRREYETNEPGPINGTRFQQYKDAEFYKLNEFKSTPNPLAGNLNLAKDILKGNQFAVPAFSA
jgi:hypothetical protein